MIRAERSCSVKQFAERYQIGAKKVRALIRKGIIDAIDIGLGIGRRQVRIPPESIKKFEERLAVRPAPVRRRRAEPIDPEIERLLRDD
jgi:hypothetical protein